MNVEAIKAVHTAEVTEECLQGIDLRIRLTTYLAVLQPVGAQVIEGADLQATTGVDLQQVAILVHLKTCLDTLQAVESPATTEVEISVIAVTCLRRASVAVNI